MADEPGTSGSDPRNPRLGVDRRGIVHCVLIPKSREHGPRLAAVRHRLAVPVTLGWAQEDVDGDDWDALYQTTA